MEEQAAAHIIDIREVNKSYHRGAETLVVLDRLNLFAKAGEFLALMGPSGSGKTTLLNIIAGLDAPDAGDVVVAGTNLGGLSEAKLTKWRLDTIGFVFQSFNLIPVLTALENVVLPLTLLPMSKVERLERAKFVLRIVGLEERMNHLPSQLSGGQEQRVAIARAIVVDPQILVADEPTGDLDRKAAMEIMELLTRLNREFGKTIVMVTHDQHAAQYASRVIQLDKGQLVEP